jgi:hypothetical protein
MTCMLSSLAGGKVVVALEVSLSLKRLFFPHGYRVDTLLNRSPTARWL